MSLRFLSLASGSSGNCYYLGTDNHGILIDAGIGIRSIKKGLREHGIELETILGVFITHDHTDHIRGVGVLGEKYNIPIFATATVHDGINRNYCVTEKIGSSRREIEKEKEVLIGAFSVTAFEVPHDGSDNVGYYIEHANHKFAFATDLGSITPTVSEYLKKANYIVLEANYDREMLAYGKYPPHLKSRISNPHGHLSNHETASFAASILSSKLTHLFLCHLSKENNHPELALKTVTIRLQQEGAVIGEDIEVIALKRTSPSDLYTFI